MQRIDNVLGAINDVVVAEKIDKAHQRARQIFDDRRTVIRDYREFEDVTSRFVIHQSREAVGGGTLSRSEAIGQASHILNQSRRYGSVNNAYQAAVSGRNGGLPGVLDEMASVFTDISSRNYIRAAIDQYVSPVSWEDRKAIVREIFSRYRHILPADLQNADPDQFANNYSALIEGLADAGRRYGDQLWRNLP